jgi:hypothetical protein
MIILTGWNGYVGSVIEKILISKNVNYLKAGRSKDSDIVYTLENGFAETKFLKGAKIIHCAYNFGYNRHLLNVNAARVLADQLASIGSSLLLISSASVAQYQISDYAKTKSSIEEILFDYKNCFILRVGVLVEKDNPFLRLIKVLGILRITTYPTNRSRIFTLTTLLDFETNILNYCCHKYGDKTRWAYSSQKYNFSQLENIICGRKLDSFLLPIVNVRLFLYLIMPLRKRLPKLNRLFNSVKLLNGNNENLKS